MKKICYFKRGDIIPKNATYLCLKRKLIKSDVKPLYEEFLVYEIEEAPSEIKKSASN